MASTLSKSNPTTVEDRSQKQSVTLLRHLETLVADITGATEQTLTPEEQRRLIIRLFFTAMVHPNQPEDGFETVFNTSPPSGLTPLAPTIEKLGWTLSLFALTPAHLGSLYEVLLGLHATPKKSGSFYTPYPLARAMANALLNHLPDTKDAHILDPALGGGIFIQALCDAGHPLSQIHGWDQDPLTVETTRLALWWEAGCPGNFDAFLADRFTVNDTLASIPSPSNSDADDALSPDAVIGNPPYLSVKQGLDKDKRTFYETHYETARGQYDLYGLFIENSLRRLKPGGILAFLLPKPMLVNDQQRPVRELLLRHQLLEVWDIGKDAFVPKAAVESTVIIVKKLAHPHHLPGKHLFKRIEWDVQSQTPQQTGEIRQTSLGLFPEKSINLWLTPDSVAFLNALEKHSMPLKNWLTSPYGRGMEIGKNQCRRTPRAGLRPVLTGQDVLPFYLPGNATFYAQFDENDPKYHKPLALYTGPKLIIRRVADRPIAALDHHTHWLTLNTLYNFHFNDPTLLPVACAVINSDVIARWFRERFYFSERLFPYLRQQQILELPMPTLETLQARCETGPFSGATYQEALTRMYEKIASQTACGEDIGSLRLKLNDVAAEALLTKSYNY